MEGGGGKHKSRGAIEQCLDSVHSNCLSLQEIETERDINSSMQAEIGQKLNWYIVNFD